MRTSRSSDSIGVEMIDFDDEFCADTKGAIRTIIISYYDNTVLLVRNNGAIDPPSKIDGNIVEYVNDLKTYCNNYSIEYVEYKRGKS